ncbi:hypothetical protein C6P46_004676 [Rhodotorula mucilaginosa]|uniref:Uncharacterized protein n=1 Tax=Rhodotorula mucilaginosa TaxID=5537 RepID=A0A9P6W1V4_RHOMI|nr:hypothetical protein C6P46_004676 [Rhodotorula mucilaginosa]
MQPTALSHVPTAFVQDVLIKLAPRILAGADCLTVEEPQTEAKPFPPSLRCSISSPPHLPKGYAIRPTHLLLLTFDGSGVPNSATTRGAEPPLRLMVPIHEAVWSLRCHTVARLVSSSPSSPSSTLPSSYQDANDTFDLPVIPFPGSLPLAAFSTFSVLHTYLHTGTLPSHLSSPDSRPGDDDDDLESDSDSDSGSEFEDDDEEDIDFASDDDDGDDGDEDVEDPLLLNLQQREQYQSLHSMCRAFGISGSDPIYEWMAAAEGWRGAAAMEESPASFARGSKGVADTVSVDEEDLSPSSCSHLPTPPPG